MLWSDTCRGGLPVWEKASQQDHLTDADNQEDDGFSNGPEGNTGVEVFCPTASLGLTETEMCLVVNDRLQGLMDGNTSWFHLETKMEGKTIKKNKSFCQGMNWSTSKQTVDLHDYILYIILKLI